jgi:hypothetical protein
MPLAILLGLVLALTLIGVVDARPPQGGPARDPRLAKDIKRGSYEGRQSLPSVRDRTSSAQSPRASPSSGKLVRETGAAG